MIRKARNGSGKDIHITFPREISLSCDSKKEWNKIAIPGICFTKFASSGLCTHKILPSFTFWHISPIKKTYAILATCAWAFKNSAGLTGLSAVWEKQPSVKHDTANIWDLCVSCANKMLLVSTKLHKAGGGGGGGCKLLIYIMLQRCQTVCFSFCVYDQTASLSVTITELHLLTLHCIYVHHSLYYVYHCTSCLLTYICLKCL